MLAFVVIPQFASGMAPARSLDEALAGIELTKADEGVSLRDAVPALEVSCGVLDVAAG